MELGATIWITLPLAVIALYGIAARRNIVRIMMSLELMAIASITVMGAVSSSWWRPKGEVMGMMVLVAISVESAILIAIATYLALKKESLDIRG